MAADKRKGVIAPPLQSLSLGQEHAKEARRANDKRNSNGDDSLTRGPRQSITMVTRGGCAKKEREKKMGFSMGACVMTSTAVLETSEATRHVTTELHFLRLSLPPYPPSPPHVHDLVSCSRPRPCHLTERKLPIMSE